MSHTVVVIGAGSIGMKHLNALRSIEGATPIAIPVRPERLRDLQTAGFKTAVDVADAVASGATHAIVATNTGRHVQDALTCINAGLDVLVEKPLSTDAAKAIELCRQAERAGRHAYVACVLRFSESLNCVREWLPRIEPLHSVHIECQSYLPEWRPGRPFRESYSAGVEEGGVLRDLIHEIDYALWLFGIPDALQAIVRNTGKLDIPSDDIAHLAWVAPKGVLVAITLDYLSRPHRRRLRASGAKGEIEWNGIEGTAELSLNGEPGQTFRKPNPSHDMLVSQARAFLDARTVGRDIKLATCREGAQALALCDAARASTGRNLQEVKFVERN